VSNTKDPKSGIENESIPLIERAAALIGEDDLSERARNNRQSPAPEKGAQAIGNVAVKSEETPSVANQLRPNQSQEELHRSEIDEAGDRKSKNGGKDLLEISQIQVGRSHIFTPGSDQSRSIEEFRQIKQSLLHRMYAPSEGTAKNSNLILVTSARPNEGKTFVSVNLAIALAAEKDLSVLLIDADQTKRGITETLGISKSARGLIDVIEDTALTWAEVIIETDIAGLSVLPSGTYHPLGSELLNSRKMKSLLKELGEAREGTVVIIDTPPVLATTEAAILAQDVGQVVFVVEADKTNRTTIEDALEIIGHNPNIGFVLNKTRIVVGDSQYGSYYSYGHDKPNAA
jgi:protein-tyrosine kinase